jgi:ribosomal protein S18 acetylase RimI-like enzyme
MMAEPIALQKVGQKDMRAVVELLKQFTEVNEVKLIKLLETRIHSERHLLLLAKDDKTPVGLLECAVHDSITLWGQNIRGVVSALVVAEPYRRKGIASQLISTAGFWFSGNGVEQITCELPISGTEAELFFISQGYEKTAIKVSKSS